MHQHKTLLIALISISLLLLQLNSWSQSSPNSPHLGIIRVAASDEISNEYAHLTRTQQCADDNDILSTHHARGTIELIIICRALQITNSTAALQILPAPNYGRALRMVENNEADISAETIWSFDIQDDIVYRGSAIIPWGKFEKGIYTIERHPMLKIPAAQIDLNNYKAVTIRDWRADWQALSGITSQIYSATRLSSRFSMLEAGRADFTLLTFPNTKDLSITIKDLTMRPIEGLKVKLPHSRHFVVSKKTQHGAALHQQLEQGIKQLQQDGTITKLLGHVGLNNKHTKNWKVINREQFEQANALEQQHKTNNSQTQKSPD